MASKIKKLKERKVIYIKKCFKKLGLEVMEACIIKEFEAIEEYTSLYLTR